MVVASLTAIVATAWTLYQDGDRAIRSIPLQILAALFLLGAVHGLVTARVQSRGCAARWVAGPQSAIIELRDRPSRKGLTTGRVRHSQDGCGGEVALRLDSTAAGGQWLLVSGVFRPPGLLHVTHARVLAGPHAWRFAIRDAVGERVNRLYGARAPLVEALVTGRREDLDKSLQHDFAASGLAHLLSISGLHVGIMAAWLVMILKWFLPRRLVLVVSTTVSWLYVILLGCPAPATRTVAFISIHALSRWRQRHPPAVATLAVAALFIMALDPSAIISVGAWLSVCAVWGTGEATASLPEAARRSPIKSLVAASVGATVVTAPITAYTFGAIAPVGIVANLVAVPLSGVAVPAVFFSLFAGGWMASGAGLALAGIEKTASLAAALPGGHFAGAPGAWFAAPWLGLLAAALWARHRQPTWAVARRRLLWSTAGAGWVALVAAALPPARHAPLELHVLDVGQGDAIAIRTPHGHWALIDAGPRTPVRDAGRDVVLPFFRREGVHHLELLIASHADADHLGGIPTVIRGMDPALMLENGQPVGTSLFLEHLSAIDAEGVPWHAARAGDTLVVDSVVFAVLHPSGQWMATRQETNENSVVVRLSYGAFDAVLTGDAGFPAESTLAHRVPRSEVLKIGHHGSAGASSAEWLSTVTPLVAVISVGQDNRYGHPSPATLARIAASGAVVRRTDQGGTVTVGTDGRTFWVEQQRRLPLTERVRCLLESWLPSSASSSSRSGCTVERRVSYPTFSTTSPSPPR